MSKPVEEFEISALIDGELDPQRAAEVRSALEQNPALQAQFTRLAAANHHWTAKARAAQFTPALPPFAPAAVPSPVHPWLIGVLAVLLLAGRIFSTPSMVGFSLGLLIHALMLTAVIALVVWICGPSEQTGKLSGPTAS